MSGVKGSLNAQLDCGDIEGVIRGKRADYEPGGAKKLEAKSDMGDVRIRFTEG